MNALTAERRPELFYMIGPPGVGKSSVMSHVTANCIRRPVSRPFAHDVLARPDLGFAVELGSMRDGGYPGTDSLSMSVQPKVLSWLIDCGYRLVLGEGDRLGNISFMEAAMGLGWHVHLARLSASPATLARRRAGRGSNQNEAWMKGRATKVANLAAWAVEQQLADSPITVYEIEGNAEPREIASVLRLLVPSLRKMISDP